MSAAAGDDRVHGFPFHPRGPARACVFSCPSARAASIDSEPALPYTLAHALALGAQPALEEHAAVSVTETSGGHRTFPASSGPFGTRPVNETRIHVFPDSIAFGQRLGRAARLPTVRIALHRFPDGESLVRIRQPAGQHAVVVRSLFNPNVKLVETILAADALRQAGAQRVTLVAPYLPYMRQDTIFSAGEPISQRAVGALLGRDFDAVLTVEAHLHRVFALSEVVPGRARSISAAPAIGAFLARRRRRGLLLVGPDEESRPWVQAVAATARVPWIVGEKTRLGDRSVRIHFSTLPNTRRAVLLDDIASSGTTLAAGARALRRAGVDAVEAIVVHAIFVPGALGRVRGAGVTHIASCDTIPHPTNAIRTAPLVAQALAWK